VGILNADWFRPIRLGEEVSIVSDKPLPKPADPGDTSDADGAGALSIADLPGLRLYDTVRGEHYLLRFRKLVTAVPASPLYPQIDARFFKSMSAMSNS
jgi:hypothetical protein